MPVTVHRAISVPEVQAYVVPPKLTARVKHAAPAKKTIVAVQSIILSFCLRDLPGCGFTFGKSRRYAGAKMAPITRLM